MSETKVNPNPNSHPLFLVLLTCSGYISKCQEFCLPSCETPEFAVLNRPRHDEQVRLWLQRVTNQCQCCLLPLGGAKDEGDDAQDLRRTESDSILKKVVLGFSVCYPVQISGERQF